MIKAFGNYVYVKPVEKMAVIVGENEKYCEYGEILSVGDEVKKLKVGQKIGFLPWGVKHIDIDDVRHYFVSESDFVLCVLD